LSYKNQQLKTLQTLWWMLLRCCTRFGHNFPWRILLVDKHGFTSFLCPGFSTGRLRTKKDHLKGGLAGIRNRDQKWWA
jgi:hypothetical protein